MAVHAVHAPPFAVRELIRRDAVHDVLAYGSGTILHADPRDHLTLVVRRDVLDLVGDVHVPVDALRDAGPLAAAADMDLQRRHRLGVLLVFAVLGHAADLVAVEFLRPVALLASLARRPQSPHGRRSRTRIGVKRDSKHLPQTGDLRSRETRRAGTDVALHARDARVRAVLVGRELRLHHGVTHLPAELRRVHVLDAAVRRQRHDDDVRHRQAEDDDGGAAMDRIVEVDSRPVELGRRPPVRATLPLDPSAEGNQQEPDHENRWQDQKEQNAEIRIGVQAKEIGEKYD